MKVKARVLSLIFALTVFMGTALPAFADETDSKADTSSSASDKGDTGDSKAADTESSSDTPATTVEAPDPSKERYYLDLAEVLTTETKATILDKNKKLEGNQEIVVVTVNATEGSDSEGLAKRIFSKWEIGGKERANGLLLLLDPGNQTYYGLSGAGLSKTFPESVLSSLLATNLEADFTNERYDAGVRKTFDAFYSKLLTVDVESTASEESTAKKGGVMDAIWGFVKVLLIIIGIILLLALIFVVLVNVRSNQRKKRRRSARRSGQSSSRSSARSSSSRRQSTGRSSQRSTETRADSRRHTDADDYEEDDGWQE